MMQPSVLGQPTVFSTAPPGSISAHSSRAQRQPAPSAYPSAGTTPAPALQRRSSTNTSGYTRVDGGPSRNMAGNDRGDSWVEVSSQPSDSYTSSSSSMENIVITEGLRAQTQARKRAARLARQLNQTGNNYTTTTGKDENEMQDSSDDIDAEDMDASILNSMGSSIALSSSEGYDDEDESSSGSESSEDDDDNAVLSGHRLLPPRPALPQPRASSFSRAPPQPDHDAALRASLSTLLSCAAAARALPKPRQDGRSTSMATVTGPRPMGVHMETITLMTNEQREAMMEFVAATPASAIPTATAPTNNNNTNNYNNATIANRAIAISSAVETTLQRRESSRERRRSVTSTISATSKTDAKNQNRRHRHRHRSSNNPSTSNGPFPLTPANMTYVTLAVSAGAVILVSAISFSAGYALGKEVGRGELFGSDGQELVRRGMGRAGGRIVMSSGVGSGLRSISVS